MSSQSYLFNPTERTLAAAGDGFSAPRLTTTDRLALSLGVNGKGMMVYDTTLTTLCLWNGTAWEFITDNSSLFVSVKDYGAKGDGVTNDTTAFNAAIATGKRVYVPTGTYMVNATINIKTIIEGDGSTASILKPFNVATAALTYTQTASYNPTFVYWSYHSEIRNIGFNGIGTKTGVGFTFAKTDPTQYQALDEFANNVKFYGCFFYNLEKGVQFPFGNIGSDFYSCGFQANKYGVYTLNNKFGGIMHAGNKYFYSGEFSGNECAFYCNNTADGFGGIQFTNTIFEVNLVSVYIYNSPAALMITPIKWDGCWFEANGQTSGGAATVTIDQWAGTVRSNLTLTKQNMIFEGLASAYELDKCFGTGISLTAINTTVSLNECRVENTAGYDGSPCSVTDSSSVISVISPSSNGQFIRGDSIVTSGFPRFGTLTIGSSGINASGRWFITQARSSKIANYGPSRTYSAPLTTVAQTGAGTFNLVGTVVADGIIYSQCNEFTRVAFGGGEFTRLTVPDSLFVTTAGYYVFTFDMKVTAGDLNVFIWDRSTANFAQGMKAPAVGKWYTFAGIGYSAGGQTLFFDFAGSNVNVTWRISAIQILRFDTFQQAQAFLNAGAFAES
jgi:hypothetical protein